MDINKIIDNLLERIKGLVRENAFLSAQLQTYEEQQKAQQAGTEGADSNA